MRRDGRDMPGLCPIFHQCFQGTRLEILYHQQFKTFPFAGWRHVPLLPHGTPQKVIIGLKHLTAETAPTQQPTNGFIRCGVKMHIFQRLTRDIDCSFLRAAVDAPALPTRSEAALQRLVLTKVHQDIKHNDPE